MPGGARHGSGRKRVNIDAGELEKLCALQCTDAEIAAWFGVSTRTIERRRRVAPFGEAMERGKAKGKLSLRRSLWRLASGGNPAANIFLAKNLLGYRDVVNTEHSGIAGGPIQLAARPDLSQLTDEELDQLRAIARKTLSGGRDRPGTGEPPSE
jgi:hypothetical protein